ncbi:hypothetical protein DPMN_116230 [Dreissena polymorpha]|uniref:Cadherin domain-containing protein n=1 Tax=Dreissena polymorpha TaxID=45954 RepID=A0A9D4KPF9_DREPO|nr:hypothetical protein DPMN_116230 [Dreissena polymorpha]
MVTAQSSNGATINYAIAGGNINDAFGIERSTGRIYSAGTIDYELLQEYHLWIEARQDGNTPATAFAKVMIKIEDTNDNSPVFSSTQYDIDVMENRGFGTSIYTVSATDADSGVNGNINYILSGTDAQYFKVTSSGQIRTYTTIDREKVDKYSFLVIATDQVRCLFQLMRFQYI